MSQATTEKVHRGGFTATKVFGWDLPDLFPDMEFTGEQCDGVAVVIEIPGAIGLRLSSLSKVLLGAAKGGIKTAIVCHKGKNMVASIDMLSLWLTVEEMWELRQCLIEEHKERRKG